MHRDRAPVGSGSTTTILTFGDRGGRRRASIQLHGDPLAPAPKPRLDIALHWADCSDFGCPGWQRLDDNVATTAFAAAGRDIYQLYD